MSRRIRLPALLTWSATLTVLVTGIPAAGFAVTASPPAARPAATAAATLGIVPKPVSAKVGQGRYTLARQTRIVAAAGASAATELAVARDLAAYLRPATGYRLPVVTGTPRSGDIVLAVGHPPALRSHQAEGYQLDTTASGARIEASSAHGLYNGIQTFRQLLPAWISSPSARPGPWTAPVVSITDYPRYSYRAVMLDIGRHFEPPSAVEKLISQAAAYKINVFHLHLSDDQGFRLAIRGFPRLTRIGGRGSVGTGGRAMDPGGFWTQAQYKAVVADAAAHFMTLVPEVDSPGHNNAIIMSEYNDSGNPALPASPHGINCGQNNPPRWDYTEDVGYSALCPGSRDTWAIMTAIIDQLTAASPGPYYDLGGDEVPTSLLSAPQYAAFINSEAPIVSGRGKTVMGWADIAGQGTRLPAGSVAEYWQPAGGKSAASVTGRQAVAKHMKIVMAPANHTYLDQKYIVTGRSSVPPSLGMNWACPAGWRRLQRLQLEPRRLRAWRHRPQRHRRRGRYVGRDRQDAEQRRLHGLPAAARARGSWLVTVGAADRHQPRLPRLPAAPGHAGRSPPGGRSQLLPLHPGALDADRHRDHPDRQRPRPGARPDRDTVGTRLAHQHAVDVRLLPRHRLRDQVGRREHNDRRRHRPQCHRHPGQQPVRHHRRAQPTPTEAPTTERSS